MANKTFQIVKLIEMVNDRNASATGGPAERSAWNSILDEVLEDAGAYVGFRYLAEDEVPPGEAPGIAHGPTDETRRHYYSHVDLWPDPRRKSHA
jgi:hypothetical protein